MIVRETEMTPSENQQSLTHNQERRGYPTQATIDRVIRAARKAGISVGGIEVSPDGVIRILDASEIQRPKSQADEWV